MDGTPGNKHHVTTEMSVDDLTYFKPISDLVSVDNDSTGNYTNGSENDQSLDRFYFYQTEEVTFLAVLLVCIVVGNSIVLLAVGLSRRRHSRMHFFIMHLALADLSVGLVHVLGDLIWKITVKWYAGNVMCKLLKFAQACVVYASTYMLVALSIDRYDAIARPLSFSTTWTRCKVYVGVAWALSALFSSPLLFLSSVEDGTYECWMSFPETDLPVWLIYFVCVMSAVLILPALIITACYTLIIIIIWKNSHLLSSAKPKQIYTAEKKFLVPPKSSTLESVTPKGSPKRQRSSQNIGRSSKGIIPQAKIRTVKMTFTIVLAFIICWSPYFIFNLCSLLGYVPATQDMVAVTTFVQSLAPLNSAVNPLIYGIFSTRVCRYLRQLKMFRYFSKLFCCQDGRTPRGSGISDFSNVTDTDFYRKSPRVVDDISYKSRSTLDITADDYSRRSRGASNTSDMRESKSVDLRHDYNHCVEKGSSSGNDVEMCDFLISSVSKPK